MISRRNEKNCLVQPPLSLANPANCVAQPSQHENSIEFEELLTCSCKVELGLPRPFHSLSQNFPLHLAFGPKTINLWDCLPSKNIQKKVVRWKYLRMTWLMHQIWMALRLLSLWIRLWKYNIDIVTDMKAAEPVEKLWISKKYPPGKQLRIVQYESCVANIATPSQ